MYSSRVGGTPATNCNKDTSSQVSSCLRCVMHSIMITLLLAIARVQYVGHPPGRLLAG